MLDGSVWGSHVGWEPHSWTVALLKRVQRITFFRVHTGILRHLLRSGVFASGVTYVIKSMPESDRLCEKVVSVCKQLHSNHHYRGIACRPILEINVFRRVSVGNGFEILQLQSTGKEPFSGGQRRQDRGRVRKCSRSTDTRRDGTSWIIYIMVARYLI